MIIFLIISYIQINSAFGRNDTFINKNLISFTPEFGSIPISIQKTKAFIVMKPPPSYITYELEYHLEINEINTSKFDSDLRFFRNWQYSDEEVAQIINTLDDSYWIGFSEIYSGFNRHYTINNLKPLNKYQIRFRFYHSQYGYSNYSLKKLLFTKKNDLSSEKVILYAKGTAKGNHQNAEVILNNQLIMKNGNFTGLALTIIDRKTLNVDEIIEYNTMISYPSTNITARVTDYTYNNDGSLNTIIIDKTITVDNTYIEVNNLIDKLKTVNETKIIVLVSCYGWEKYITNELLNILSKFGGLNILEFKNINENDFINENNSNWNNQRLINWRPYYHPFAFIGIRNMIPGMAYESIRTNKANFLTVDQIPLAEIKLMLNFNYFNGNYYFDKSILGGHKLQTIDSYDLLWNSTDYSLSNLLPLLSYSNHTKGYNLGFSIYDHNIKKDKLQSNTTKYSTMYDKVVLNGPSVRYNYAGNKYQEGQDITLSPYYKYFISVFKNENMCNPPYNKTDTNECPNNDILNQTIPILACRIGITPQLCITNTRIKNLLSGYT